MSEAFKICPICDTPNHRNAMICTSCGTSLAGVNVVSNTARSATNTLPYDFRYGELDLYEGSLQPVAKRYLIGMTVVLVLVMLAGAALMFAPQLTQVTEAIVTQAQRISIVTNTLRPTLPIATVTEGPPTLTPSRTPTPSDTITPTPTREPCIQKVEAGEGLYGPVLRCGHLDLFVITQVIELNNLNDENDIVAGQMIQVPWPTETLDPNATSTPSETPKPEANANASPAGNASDPLLVAADGTVDVNATLRADPFYRPTATLPAGVMYHVVRSDDNAIIIVDLYNTSVEVLSQLNPEIGFSQCDFGITYGGPRCIIPLGEGQKIRVPAPTPTTTLSPTPSGSETRTPTPTATYNAPSQTSPSNQAYFRKDQFVTLRWIGTGVLENGHAYRVIVKRLNDNLTYASDTQDLYFVLPADWQGTTTERYEYTWTISVVDSSRPNQLFYTTEALTFTWEGRGEATVNP